MNGGASMRSVRTETWAMSAAILALVGACAAKGDAPRRLAGAEPERGRSIIEQVGCAACHTIPGVAWPQGRVGGALAGFARRTLIAGQLPNQPDILVRWLRDAPSLSPETGMPAIPLTEAEARDIAAYLYTLDD